MYLYRCLLVANLSRTENGCCGNLIKFSIKCLCSRFRRNRPDVFSREVVLKLCCKFTGEHLCRSAILIKLESNLQLYWNRTSAWVFFRKFAAYFQNIFFKNTFGGLLLKIKTASMQLQFRQSWEFLISCEWVVSILAKLNSSV